MARRRTKWGSWRLATDTMHLVLEENGSEAYAVPLEEMTDSARMLDWIFQLKGKTWATNDIMGDMLSALDDLIGPQGTLCSGGHGKTLNAKKHLKELLATHKR